MLSAKIRSANIGSRNVASTTRVAMPEITGNSISSLSERSTEALALTRSQLRENFSNMACLRWMVRILPGARGARNAGMQVEDAAGGADVTGSARVPGKYLG